MKFKVIDMLSITECCEILNLRKKDLPQVLQNFNESTESDQLLITRLISLLEADKSAFESCTTIEQYEAYIRNWPDGFYCDEAQSRINQLKAVEAEEADKRNAEAVEFTLYKNSKDSISGCEAYLQKYPKGRFVKEVQLLLAQKKKLRKIRNAIIFISISIAAIIFACSNYVPVSYIDVDDNVELNNLGSEISLDISTDAISSTITATCSENWINCRVSGKTLYISADTNSKSERSTIVTISAYSSLLGCELSDMKQTTINVSQKTGNASYLDVLNDDIYLSANGGQSSVSIQTDGIFAVSTAPASWVTTSVNGKTLNLECGENSGIARSSYLILKSGTKTLRLDITQAGKSATRLDVSTSDVEFSANGGSRTIEIYTDGECQISTQPESWAHATINGNSISLSVDENPETKRTDYFVIKSGSYTERINISQAGKQASFLKPSQTNISISHSGGTRTITVTTDGTWEFGTDTESWIDLSRSGNTITLDISSYSGSSDRSDYFTIKSGNLEKRINITQTADNTPRAEVNRVWVEHNIPRTGYNYWGWQQVPYTYNVMRIHVDFDVDNMKGKTIYVCVYFYDEDGNKMRSSSNNYKTSDGQVAVHGTATATSKNSNWSNFTIEIPYSAITKGDNKFVIQILDNNGKYLGESDYEYFTCY